MSEIQQRSKKRAMLVLVGCCLMQMVGLVRGPPFLVGLLRLRSGVGRGRYGVLDVMWISMGTASRLWWAPSWAASCCRRTPSCSCPSTSSWWRCAWWASRSPRPTGRGRSGLGASPRWACSAASSSSTPARCSSTRGSARPSRAATWASPTCSPALAAPSSRWCSPSCSRSTTRLAGRLTTRTPRWCCSSWRSRSRCSPPTRPRAGSSPTAPRKRGAAAAAGSKPGVPLKYAVGSVTFVVLIVACIGCCVPRRLQLLHPGELP